MANKKLQATATLFLDVSNAKNDAKQFVADIKSKLADIETAADKMTVFKDMVNYIAQVDRALSALQKNNPDMFKNLFDGIDANLKEQLQSLFNLDSNQLKQIDVLREKLNTLTPKSGIKELRNFAKEINTVFKSVGLNEPFNIEEQFVGKANAGHIELLTGALTNFATVWNDVNNRISKGFGGSGIGGQKGSGSPSRLSKEVQEEIDKLNKQKKEIQEAVDAINNIRIKIDVTPENDAAELQQLIDSYHSITKEINSIEFRSKATADEYNQKLAERVRLASLLVNTAEDVQFNSESSDEGVALAASSAVGQAQDFLDSFYENSKAKIASVKQSCSDLVSYIDAQVNKKEIDALSVDSTKESISDVLEALKKLNQFIDRPDISTEAYNMASESIDVLTEKIKKLATTEEQIDKIDELLDFGDFDYDNDTLDNRLNELCETLSVTIPNGVAQTKDAFEKNTQDAAEAVERFNNLVKEIKEASFFETGDALDNIDVGRYLERLEAAKAELDALGVQGVLTADQLEAVNTAFASAKDHLEYNTKRYTGFGWGDATSADLEAAEDAAEEARVRAENAESRIETLLEENDALREQINDLTSQSDSVGDASDDIDDIQRENGALEQKLELLKEIADAYGVQITQKARNRYDELTTKEMEDGLSTKEENRLSELSDTIDEADSNLCEFEETYERIILKLSNGKKIEILPDDDGLRKLYKISNEYFDGEYNGFEIDDIEFVRQEQFIRTQIESYDELCDVVKRFNELRYKDRTGKENIEFQSILDRFKATKGDVPLEQMTEDAIKWTRMINTIGDIDVSSFADYLGIQIPDAANKAEAAIDEISDPVKLIETGSGQFKLFDDVIEGAQRAEDAVENLNNEVEKIGAIDGQVGFDDYLESLRDTRVDNLDTGYDDISVSAEISELNALQQKLFEVQAAVDAKTQAFEEEYVTVDAAVDAEIASLNKLKGVLEEIQGILQFVFSSGTTNLGDINISQDKNSANNTTNVIQGIQQTLGQILSVLQVFTGLEADGQNSITRKEAAATGVAETSAATELLSGKLSELATENTLSQIPSAIRELADAISKNTQDESEKSANTNDSLNTLISALSSNITSLKEVMNGVVQQQRSQRNDTSKAMVRIQDPNDRQNIVGYAKDAVKAYSDDVEIESVQALANGLVKVEGAFKNVNGEWEGFTVKVNEANKAVDLAMKKHSAFAKLMKEQDQKVDTTTSEKKTDDFAKKKTSQANTFEQYVKDLNGAAYGVENLQNQLNELDAELQSVGDESSLDSWIAKFEKLQNVVNNAKTGFVKENETIVDQIQKELSGSYNRLSAEQQAKLLPEYARVLGTLKQQKQAVQDGQAVRVEDIQAITSALQNQINVQLQANKAAKEAEKIQKKNSKFGDTAMINATAKHNTLSQLAQNEQFVDSKKIKQAFETYNQAYTKLKNMRDTLSSKEDITTSDREAFKEATTECNNYAKALEKLIKDSVKLHGERAHEDTRMLGADFDDTVGSRREALTNFAKEMYDVSLSAENFRNNFNEAIFAVKNGDGTLTQMTAQFTAARNEIVATAGATKKIQSPISEFFDELKGKFKSIGSYLIASVSFYEVWNVLKQGVTYVKDIDSALTELKKVTNETDASYANFLQNMAKTGGVIGATVSDLTTMAAEWARLGYSMEEAGKLAESTAILLNVSEFQDATSASEALISTMQAFQYTADESQRVVDILNEVGNNYAVSSDGIATALQDSASALMEAGNNLEQSVALVAAANKVVQDPNSVGSALRTISLRLRGTSVEVLEGIGEETDGVVESVSKLQEKIEALTGVNILTDTGAYKDTYTILQEIGAVWEEMSDIDQAALLELMAGKNRANTLAAILGNMEDLAGAYESAMDAEGSAMRENEAYLNSIQGRIDLFNNSVQTMWMNFIDTDTVKFIVDLGTGLMKLIDSATVLRTILFGLFTYMNASSKFKLDFASMLGLYDVKNEKFSFGKSGLTKWIADGIKSISAQLKTTAKVEIPIVPSEEFEQTDFFYAMADGAKSAEESVSGLNQQLRFMEDEHGQFNFLNNLDTSVESYQSMFTALADIKNIELSMGDEQDVAGKIDAIANAAKNGQSALADYASTLGSNDIALKAYIASVDDGNYSLAGFQKFIQTHNAGLKASGIAAKAAAVGHQILNAALSMGVSLLISGAISAISKLVNAEKEVVEAANDAVSSANKIQENSKSLNAYKKQISELRAELDNNTLSESDAYDAREKLLTIQSELIDKFGLEASGINLVTGAIENQINAIDRLSQADAQRWLNENQKAINGAIEYFDDQNRGSQLDGFWEGEMTSITNWGSTANVSRMIEEYAQSRDHMETSTVGEVGQDIDFKGSVEEVKQEVEDFQDWLSIKENELLKQKTDLLSLPDQSDEVKAQIKALEADISQLQDVREDLGVEYTNWFGTDSLYASNKALIEQTQQNTAVTKYADQYMKILDAENALLDAQKSGDKDTIKAALDNLNAATAAASKDAKDNGQNYMVNFFDGIRSEYAKLSNEFKLEDDLINNVVFGAAGSYLEDAVTGILSELDGMNATEILQLGKIDPANSAYVELTQLADHYKLSIEDLIDVLIRLGYVQAGFDTGMGSSVDPVQTYSVLASEIESYNEILSQTSEIISDNTSVTQEYKDSLSAIGFTTEELNECFDDENKLVVKNSTLLKKLVKQKQQDKKTTIQQAKAYGQLQYRAIVKGIQECVNKMATQIKATGYVSSATLDHIGVLREQLAAIKETIQQYSLLELSLSDAANAYTEFEAAKARDAQLTYGDSMVDMLSVINEGFKTGQVGTEAFEFAVKALVPPEFYADIDNVQERMQAIHDYVDKNPVFADYFTINEGQISITMDNIKAFLQDGLDDGLGENFGVFTGTIEDFDLAPHIQSIKDLANEYGITEAAALAMLTEFEKYDASWGDIIYRLTTTELDRNIDDATTALESAIDAQEDYIRSGKQIYDENGLLTHEYLKLCKAVKSAENAFDDATQAAINNAQTDAQVSAIIKAMTGECKLSEETLNDIARSLGLIDENSTLTFNSDTGALELTEEQLTILNEKLAGLKDASILDVQLAYDQIDYQIEELKKRLNGEDYDASVLADLKLTDASNAEVQAMLDELTATQDVIELVYNITATSGAQDQSTMDQLATWEANGVHIVITGDTTDIDASIEEVNAVEMDEKPVKMTTNAEETNAEIDTVTNNNPPDKTVNLAMSGISVALDDINSIGSALDAIEGTRYVTFAIDTEEIGQNANGNFHISGGAFASGTVGAPNTETSLVGELGPELIVDPSTNRWHTVGEHGAEFTQVKRGQIIFNHKQTEQLLKNGYVTGRGRLQGGNSAFASGTAYANFGIYDPYVGDGDAIENGSDEWVDPYTNATEALSDALADAADSVGEFEETIDWIETRMEEFDERIGKLNAELENLTTHTEKNAQIDKIIAEQQKKYADSLEAAKYYEDYAQKYLEGMNSTLVDAAKNGAIAITEFTKEQDEATVQAIQNYREYAQKAADMQQQAEEAITEIANLAKQAIDNIADSYDNKTSVTDSKNDRFDAENAYLETTTGFESEEIFKAMMQENESKMKDLAEKRDAMQAELDKRVSDGEIAKYSDAWYEAVNAIAAVDTEIIQLKTDNANFQDSINELHWEKFDLLIKQFEAINDEADNLIDILGDKDVTDELGNWTNEGITSLGLYAQKMEVAEKQAEHYKQEIEYLNKNWKDLGYTQEEYIDKLDELKSGQYDSIQAYREAKDAISDLNKERIDAIKKGIEKEIDAYEKLIKKKKEALDADKDAHDFQKTVADQQKNIEDIERKIAALSGDNSASARAKRAQLESELLKAKADLEETYYDRSIEEQQNALDRELENFQENKETEIENLDKYLENVELVVADSLAMVQQNTQVVLETLTTLGQEFGLTITDSLLEPWKAGESAIQDYGTKLNMSLTEMAAMLGMTVDEMAAKLGMTTEELVSNLNITVAQLAQNLGLTTEEMAAKLGMSVSDLESMMDLTIQDLAARIGLTLPELASKLGVTTADLAGNLDITMVQFAGRMGLTVDELANKFGLTTQDLASKLGMTTSDMMNTFGSSMSSTVDALTKLENDYSKILDEISNKSKQTIEDVNKAMKAYQEANKAPDPEPAPAPEPEPEKEPEKTGPTEEDYYGVALAIVHGGFGWGDGGDRMTRLKEKGFDYNKTQDLVNKIWGQGYVHNGTWKGKYYGITDLSKYHYNKFAKGTTGVSKDQWAIIDELGEELQLVPDGNGRLAYLKKGTSVIPADLTTNLMEWGALDPSDMLNNNKPQIGVSPSIINNTTEIHVDASVGELLHVEHLDGSNPAEITKIVDKAWDKRMKELNAHVRRYTNR